LIGRCNGGARQICWSWRKALWFARGNLRKGRAALQIASDQHAVGGDASRTGHANAEDKAHQTGCRAQSYCPAYHAGPVRIRPTSRRQSLRQTTATLLPNDVGQCGNNSMPAVAPRNKSRGAFLRLEETVLVPISLPGGPLMPDPKRSLFPK
jgi:hypothetical protein